MYTSEKNRNDNSRKRFKNQPAQLEVKGKRLDAFPDKTLVKFLDNYNKRRVFTAIVPW